MARKVVSIPTSLIFAFLIGVVVPLISGAIPSIYDYYKTKPNFTYMTKDTVVFKDKTANSLIVINEGSSVEKNVEVWLDKTPDGKLEQIETRYEYGDREPNIRDDGSYKVISLGDMRSGERVEISILKSASNSENINESFFGALYVVKVLSNERIATQVINSGRSSLSNNIFYVAAFVSVIVGIFILLRFFTTKNKEVKPRRRPTASAKRAVKQNIKA